MTKRIVMALVNNAHPSEAHLALPGEKRAARALEREGKIKIRRTRELCAGYREWWASLA